jgi:hypothetical protein
VTVELYCKVFVSAPCREGLVRRVEQTADGSTTFRTVEGQELVVDVVPNDDHAESRAAGGAGDFIYFPYVLDVEPASGATGFDAFRGAVERLLDGLGQAGVDYVTAADFEHLLPRNGRSTRPT